MANYFDRPTPGVHTETERLAEPVGGEFQGHQGRKGKAGGRRAAELKEPRAKLPLNPKPLKPKPRS